ncbi:MAG: VWA domain-containing protein [Blastocatellia bacterium]|nr:VWA domain-containing protein [Blastocatellia bacterium]
MKSARIVIACLALGIFGLITFAQSGRRPVYQPNSSNPAKSSGATGSTAKADGTCPQITFPGEYGVGGLSPKVTPGAQTSSQSSDPNAEEVLKIDTTLVSIPVTVLDRSGKFIPHLTRCDFHIYEDGVMQEVAEFSTVETPFHVVLLLDTSNSTRFKMEEIHSAALAFVNQLRPQDQVMVVSFDSDIETHCEFTSNRDVLRQAIYETRTGGGTKLYDAVDWVVNERLNKIQGRKAIVLFTDGVDTSSRRASARSNIELVEESDVLVYPIQYDTYDQMNPGGYPPNGSRRPDIWGNPGSSPFPTPRTRGRWPLQLMVPPQIVIGRGRGGAQDYQSASVYLEDMATHSGGRRQNADSIGNLNSAFSSIAEELRHQYSLGYYPSNTAKDGSFRQIKVRVNQASAVVRAKAGYKAAGHSTGAENSNRPILKRRNLDPQ